LRAKRKLRFWFLLTSGEVDTMKQPSTPRWEKRLVRSLLLLLLAATIAGVAGVFSPHTTIAQLPPPAVRSGATEDEGVVIGEAETFLSQPVPLTTPLNEQVLTVAFSPDGKKLATAGAHYGSLGQFKMWDVAASKELVAVRRIPGVRTVAFSPDGQFVACGDFSGAIKLRDANTGEVRAMVKAHNSGVNGLAFSPDGQSLASAGLDRTVKLWGMKPFQESYQSLQGAEKGASVELVGKDAAQVVKFEPAGLRLTLSPGKAATNAGIGVIAARAMKGDFEITVSFELLQEPEAEDAGTQTRFSLAVNLNKPNTGDMATFSRRMTAKGPHFFTWTSLRDKETGKDKYMGREFPTKAKAGRLRLVRTGSLLSYYTAEGSNSEFTFLQQYPFGAEDLKDVRLMVAPGGPKAALDVRVTDLRIRAEALPGTAAAPGPLGLQERIVFRGHANQVYTVAFFPDGQSLVSGGADRLGKIWDVRTGKEKFTLLGHTSAVESVAVSPDGKTVATGSWDQSIKLWDAETGKELGTLPGNESLIYAVAFSPVDSNLLACTTQFGTVRFWDVKERKWLGDLVGKPPYSMLAMRMLGLLGSTPEQGPLLASSFLVASDLTPYSYRPPIWTLAFSGDGNYLACGGADTTAKVWDLTAAKSPVAAKLVTTLRTAAPAGDRVRAMAYAPDGQVVALARDDNTVHLRDAKTGDVLFILTEHTDVVTSVAFSPDSRTLASGSADKTIKLWDRTTGKEKLTLKGHTAGVNALAFSPDGQRLVSGSDDKTVKLWEAISGKNVATFKGHEGSVKAAAFAPDGQRLASAGADRTIKVWNPSKETEPLHTLKGHEGAVQALAFSADGSLASASDDETVRLWDIVQGKGSRLLTGQGAPVGALAFSPSGRTLVSGGSNAMVVVWDPVKGQPRQSLYGHGNAITALAFHPQGGQLLSGSFDGTVRWQGADSTFLLRTLPSNSGGNRFAVFSPSGERLASGGEGGVTLWSRSLAPAQYPSAARDGNYSDAAFSPDGRTLALANFNYVQLCDALSGQIDRYLYTEKGARLLAYSPDGKYLAVNTGGVRGANLGGVRQSGTHADTRLFDVATGRTVAVLPGTSDTMVAIRFSPDGKKLATLGSDNTLQQWDVPSGKLRTTSSEPGVSSSGLAFLPDGTMATSNWDGTIRFLDADAGRQTKQWRAGVGLACVDVSADGTLLAAGDLNGPGPSLIRVWEIGTGKEKFKFPGPSGRIKAVAFTRDGQGLIATSSNNNNTGEVAFWDLSSGKLRAAHTTSRPPQGSIALSRDGKRVALPLMQGLSFWDLEPMVPERAWTAHALAVSCGLFVKNGQILVTGSLDGSIKLWDLNKGELLVTFKEHSGSVRGLAVLPDGNTLLSASDDKTVKLWDLTTFKEKSTLRGHTLPVSSLAVSADGKTLASGGGDLDKPGPGELILWNLETGALRSLSSIEKAVYSVAYSPDGAWMAAGFATGVIQIWDAKTEKPSTTLTTAQVRPLTFSPDNKFLAVGQGLSRTWLEAGDGRVSLWNTATWQKRADLQKHTDLVHSVAFSPDGWTLASASQDGTIKLCSLAPIRNHAVSAVAAIGKIPIGDVLVKEEPLAAPPIVIPSSIPKALVVDPPTNPPQPVQPTAQPKPQSLAWLPMAEFIGMLITLAMVIGLGVWFRLRSPSVLVLAPADDEPILDTPLPDDYDDEPILDTPYEPEEELPPVSFQCVACGKKLKAKAELVGKKVKCKQCGKVVPVPNNNANGIEELPS
jgi:WD40 repeat protein